MSRVFWRRRRAHRLEAADAARGFRSAIRRGDGASATGAHRFRRHQRRICAGGLRWQGGLQARRAVGESADHRPRRGARLSHDRGDQIVGNHRSAPNRGTKDAGAHFGWRRGRSWQRRSHSSILRLQSPGCRRLGRQNPRRQRVAAQSGFRRDGGCWRPRQLSRGRHVVRDDAEERPRLSACAGGTAPQARPGNRGRRGRFAVPLHARRRRRPRAHGRLFRLARVWPRRHAGRLRLRRGEGAR